MSLVGIDVKTIQRFEVSAEALRAAGLEIYDTIDKYARPVVQTEWDKALRGRGDTRAEKVLIASTGTSEVGVGRITLRAGGNDDGPVTVRAWEFGANRFLTKTHLNRSRKGRTYIVHNRHTQRQFKRATKDGYVFTPAKDSVKSRFVSLIVQTTIRLLHDALETRP